MEQETWRPEGAARNRRLLRSPRDKVVAGVCGGLGRYFGIDPVIFRIAFAALAIAGGTGVLLYVIFWVAVPEYGAEESRGQYLAQHGPHRSLVGIVLLAVAAAVIIGNVFDGGLGAAVVLMAAGGALLVWKQDGGPARVTSPAARPPDEPGAAYDDLDGGFDGYGGEGGYRGHGGEGSDGGYGGGQPVGADPEPPDPDPDATGRWGDAGADDDDEGPSYAWSSGYVRYRRPDQEVDGRRRPRSYLGRLTLGVLLLVAGGFAMGSATGAFDPTLEMFLAVALLITGAALVVASRFGRARGLIPLGIVMTVLLAGASFIDVPLRGGIGDRTYRPVVASEVRDEYRLLAGSLTLDLGAVRFPRGTTEVEASVAAGEMIVFVPRDIDVTVEVDASAGEVVVLGHTEHGMGVDVRRTDEADGPPGRLELRLEVGAGRVEVQRAAA